MRSRWDRMHRTYMKAIVGAKHLSPDTDCNKKTRPHIPQPHPSSIRPNNLGEYAMRWISYGKDSASGCRMRNYLFVYEAVGWLPFRGQCHYH